MDSPVVLLVVLVVLLLLLLMEEKEGSVVLVEEEEEEEEKPAETVNYLCLKSVGDSDRVTLLYVAERQGQSPHSSLRR